MKKLFTKALNLFSVLLLLAAIGISFFAVAQPNRASAAWDGTVATSFNSGSGTEASPYVIANEKQLGYFLSQLASGVTYEGQYIQLSKSLDMTGSTWNTSHYTAFGGVFDGQGYTITADCPFMTVIGETGVIQGLNYDTHHIQLGQSLLCTTNNGTVRSCTVYGDVYASSGSPVYGGMICSKNTGTVENCGAIGKLYAYGDDTSAYAAMVIQNSGTVTGCYSAITVGACGTGKYSEEDYCPISRNGYSTNCFYDKTLHPYSAHCGEGLTTAQLQSAAFLTSLQGSSVPGTRWVTGSHGYPELTHCSTNYAYVSGYQNVEDPIIYSNTGNKSFYLYASTSGSRIYYTLDGTDPSSSSTRKYVSSGSSVSISGDVVLTMVPYYNSTYGTVTQQTFINLQGGGTVSNPYKITTKRQLDVIRLLPDKAFALKNDLTFTDADFTLGGIAAGGWSPIGSFTGTLDGEGHAIIGLRGNQGGLFTSVDSGATVTSLRLVDHKLCSPGDFGAIAKHNYGTITRCYVKSAFTVANAPSGQEPNSYFPYIGGLVGFNRGTISYCRNDGLTVGLGVTRYGQVYMGGIAGSNGGHIESCVNFGDILLRNNAHADNGYFGGIIGTGNLYDANCRSRCNIIIQNSFDYGVVCTAMSGEDPYLASVASLCIADPFEVSWQLSGYGIPNTQKYAISGLVRNSYTLQDRAVAESYPALDFTSTWMFTQEGPMPEGVMDAEGHCLYRSSYVAPTCTKTGSVTLHCQLCAHMETQTLDMIPHSYSDYVSDGNATCLEDGTKTKTCACGLSDTVADEGSALGHTFENHVSDGNATCTADGTKTGKCIRCEVTETITDTGSALGHSFTQYASNGDALCETDGTETAKCDRCEMTDTRTEADTKLGHSFTNYISNEDATCLTDGTKTAKCDRCDVTDTLTDEGTKLGHSFTNYVSDGNAGCDTDGTETAKCDRCDVTDTRTEEGSAGHLFTNYVSNGNATCLFPGTMTAKCDRCDVKDTKVEIGSTLGHSFTNYVSNGDATCLTDGTKTAKCDRCTATDTLADEGSALGHGFTSYVSDGNVTCTVDGTQTAKCDRCEVTDTITLEALGHDMSDWYTVTEASCTASGLEQSDCSRCDHSETRVVPALPHSYEAVVTEATCTEQGYTTYTCGCGDSYTDDLVAALGHSFTDYISDGNATCTQNGTQTAKCDRCDVTDTITLKALGHSFTNYTPVGNATCEADGLKIATCDRCTVMDYAVDVGSMLGHSFTQYVSNGDATCEADGTETAKCDRCTVTDTRTEENSALGHDLGGWYTETDATCTEDGAQQRDCSRCDHFETQGIPASGHSYSEEIIEPTCTEEGYTLHTCHCGDSYEDSHTEALGHSFTEYVSNGDAGCTEDGTETAKCGRCDETDTRTEENSALGHSFGQWIRDEDAGIETSTCGRCGETEEREITEYSGICGDNLTWTFNTVTGELRISGTGDMYDYDSQNDAPWEKYASAIQTVTLEEGITRIGSWAFNVWYHFTEITLPESLTSIGSYAFTHSHKLTRINIPKNLVSIEAPTFGNCENLEEFLVDPENPCYSSADGLLFNKDQTALLCYPDNHGEEFVIPANVTTVGEYAFCFSDNLRHVTIPDSITTLKNQAFYGSGIEEIVLPESLTSIADRTFAVCTSLRSVSIPDTITSIGDSAFQQCAMEEILLPDSIVSIGSGAFSHCESLKSIIIPEGIETLEFMTFWNCYSLESITIPQSVTTIGEKAFEGCDVLAEVNYGGTEEMKALLSIGASNDNLVNANWTCRICEHSFGDWEITIAPTCLEEGQELRKCAGCIATETQTVPAAGHSFTQYVSNVDASCLEDGTETAKCDRCDETDTRTEENSALGHDMGQWYTVTEPGCTEEGVKQSDCSRCDYSETQTLAAAGHSHEAIVTEPTCTEAGYTTHTCHCGDSYVDSYIPATGHSYETVVIKPTCIEQGRTTHTCQNCGDSYADNYTKALGHDWSEWKTVLEATCTQTGSSRSDCNRCIAYQTKKIPTNDNHSYSEVVTPPTCTEQGYTTHTCACGDSYVDSYTEVLGHNMGQWYTVTEPTCTEEGVEQSDCSRCGHSETQAIAAVGHSYTAVTTEPTCTEQGYTTHTCQNCGDCYVDGYTKALGHDMGQWYTVTEPTCTEEGLERSDCSRCDHFETQTIAATGHSHVSVVTAPTCTEEGYTTHTCPCGDSFVDSYTDALGHSFTQYVSNGDASCETDGTETAKCDRCGETDTRKEENSALGHEMGDWYTVKEASCTEEGIRQADCIRCDVSAVGSIPATGHSFTKYVSNGDATCLEDGTETATCDRCEKTNTRTEENSALGHMYSDYVRNEDATCTDNGTETGKCIRCDSTDTRVVENSALGHSFTWYVSDGNATCTEDGTKTAQCDRCEVTDTVTDVGSIQGHYLADSWQVVIAPTCTTEGLETAICSHCGEYQESNVIPFTGHSYEAVITEPTCTEEGYTTYTCTSCGESYVGSYVAAAGHSFGDWYMADDVERRDCENCDHYETRKLTNQKLETPVLTISANTDTGKPKISWTKVEGAEKYRIYRSTKKTSGFEYVKSTQTATSFTDTSAKVGVNYYYKIKAYHADSALNSDWSNTVNRVCDLAKPVVTMSVKTATGQPVVKWETVTGAAKYRVYRSEEESSGYELVYTGVSARSYTDKTAEAGVTYYYKVRADHSKSAANSACSAVVSQVCDLAKPTVTITLKSGDPKLSWKKVEGTEKYYIYRATSKDGEYTRIKATKAATTFTDTDVKAGKTYYYKVRAIHSNKDANSAYSSVKSIKAK